MRDLDQSDVDRDAEDQFFEWLDGLGDCTDDVALLRLRYLYGNTARAGELHSIYVVTTVDWVRAGRPESPLAWPDPPID